MSDFLIIFIIVAIIFVLFGAVVVYFLLRVFKRDRDYIPEQQYKPPLGGMTGYSGLADSSQDSMMNAPSASEGIDLSRGRAYESHVAPDRPWDHGSKKDEE